MSEVVDEEILRKYHLSRKNVLKIARYMGYTISDKHELSLEDFTEKYEGNTLLEMKEDMTMIFNAEETGLDTLILKWHLQYKLGVSVAETAEYMEENNLKKAIIVADGGVTSATGCNDILLNLKATKGLCISVWRLDESLIFVPEHVLVPQHRICTHKERKAIFKAYGLKDKTDLPNMKKDDIMVRYLNANKGQLIETLEICVSNPNLFIRNYSIVV